MLISKQQSAPYTPIPCLRIGAYDGDTTRLASPARLPRLIRNNIRVKLRLMWLLVRP